MMEVRIVKARDGVYDIYRIDNGCWVQSYNSPDNVLAWLAGQKLMKIEFEDRWVGATYD